MKTFFTNIINQQLFSKAADEMFFLMAFYKAFNGSDYKTDEIIQTAEELSERIRTTQVINPMQHDNLYADVLNTIHSMVEMSVKLPGMDRIFADFQTNKVQIERYIIDEHIAVCDNVYTKDGVVIAFCFDFEDLYPEYDKQVFVKNPKFFYLEDQEVLSVKQDAQGLVDLKTYVSLAKKHPADAIKIIDRRTNIDIVEKGITQLLEGAKSKWYWHMTNRF